ncbi:MAG: HlyC/CorC family transporter [Verrucomicrobia bacterium]|nr:HlyC/CorC family transporter [Verrucomicrobiota bacterium]
MLEVIVIVICLMFNAILAGSETAFIAVSRLSLKELAKKGQKQAQLLLLMRERPERTLSVIQIGITFVGALAAAVGGAGAEEKILPWFISKFGVSGTLAQVLSIAVVVVPLTYISVLVGELVPKTVALRRPLFLALRSAPWLYAISQMLDPIVSAFEWSTKKIVDLFPKKHTAAEELTQSEIASEIEILSPVNKQYVINLLRVEKTTIKEIMLLWKEVVYVDSSHTIQQVESIIISSGHTRLPVVQNNDVIGMINAKEFMAFKIKNQNDWISILRPALKLSSTTSILSALQIMQERRAHMAIVYNGLIKSGIVTMESIFEEIIGDIYDEDDDGTLKKILDSIHFKKR